MMSRNVLLTSLVWTVGLGMPVFAGLPAAGAPELNAGSMGGAVAILVGTLLLAREARPRH
ncbi:MAG TPA: hypothetical protein VGO93_09405 [Candidatus Xenobia bacterium]|jgi:hypothetical protein